MMSDPGNRGDIYSEELTVSDPQLVAQALLDVLDAGLRHFNDDQFIDWFHEWSFSTRTCR
jgi:hypothetical protein